MFFSPSSKALQQLNQVAPKQQLLLNSFLRIHFHNLTKALQEQLQLNHFAHLVGPIFSIPVRRARIPKPTQRSYLLERPNGTSLAAIDRSRWCVRCLGSGPFKSQTRLLHSDEPEVLMQTIKEMDTNELRQSLIELFPPVQSRWFIVSIHNILLLL